MKLIVNVQAGDVGELNDWLDNQDMVTVEAGDNYREVIAAGGTCDSMVEVTIVPHFGFDNPEQASHHADAWSRFVLQMMSQGLCC